MNSYRIDFTDGDIEITELNQPFNSEEGMSFTLPDETRILLAHSFIHEMNERIEDVNSDYEDETISDSLPNYYEV